MIANVFGVVPFLTHLAQLRITAGEAPTDPAAPWRLLAQHVVAAVVFALIGILVFAAGIWLFVKLSPFSVRREIEEDQNTALAIIMGSVLLGISIIIAAAILG